MHNPIQVFEHTALRVGHQLTPDRLDRLAQYNERHGNRFFDVGYNRVRFRNYVGVIQVGGLVIEILPKADNAPESPAHKLKWQRALVEMLRRSGLVKLTSVSDARLRLRSSSLLDIYFESFLAEVAALVHRGLVRRYRQTCGNSTTLKGRILFGQHISHNLVHKERFFVAYALYHRNNPFNQILRVALGIAARACSNPDLVAAARSLLTFFEDVDDVVVTGQTFARLPYTRTTERYRRAMQSSRLIILNYSPDVRSGKNNVLAILFDMERLFERYIFVHLKRAEAQQASRSVRVTGQKSRCLWTAAGMRKSIRPDIIVSIGKGSECRSVVLDTKWKIPADGRPSVSDLHQMHTYNIQFGAQRSLLLYPQVSAQHDIHGVFAKPEPPLEIPDHSCSMAFIELFHGDRLRRDLSDELIARIGLA